MISNYDLYDQDFHAWTEEQARLLRRGQLASEDLYHIAEEIETLGASERRELESRLKILLLHLEDSDHRGALNEVETLT